VVVQIGRNGKKIQEVVLASKKDRFPDLNIVWNDLGEGWRAGHALSVLQAEEVMQSVVTKAGSDSFLLCPADHIYETEIITAMATLPLQAVRCTPPIESIKLELT